MTTPNPSNTELEETTVTEEPEPRDRKAKDSVRKRQVNAKASTQRFLPIAEIRNDTVVLKDGGMRAVIEVEALNYNLKSETEQKAIIAGYESFVNTLGFPVQIIVRSTKVNIDPYIDQIRTRAKIIETELLREQAEAYAFFLEKIVEVADIMQKRFFVVVPFDTTEKKKGVLAQFFEWLGVDDTAGKATQRYREFKEKYTKLKDRVTTIESALGNIGLSTQRLTTQELIQLYYEVYNPRTAKEQKLPSDLRTNPLVH